MTDQNKEIDLFELVKTVINKILNNFILFVSIIIIFIVFGYVYTSTKKETFTYKSIAFSSIKNDILIKFIKNINDNNSDEKKIIPKLENISISYNETDDVKDIVYDVELILNDTSNILNTINEIQVSLESIPYINTTIYNKKQSLIKQSNYYKYELKKIKELQNLVLKGNGVETTIISINGLSKDKIDFNIKIDEIEYDIKQISSINIIHNNFDQVLINKSLLINIIIFMFLGTLFSFFVVMVKK